MRLLSSKQAIIEAFDTALDRYDMVSFAVAWATCGFDSCSRLLRAQKKIKLGVVGTHFYQTDPEFIKHFVGRKNVKFIMNPSGVFHPKVYVFHGRGTGWACLIGSANFTNGAFGKNSELLVLIESCDDQTGRIEQEVVKQIRAYWGWPTAKYADAIDLVRYRYWRDQFRRPFEQSQGRFGKRDSRKNLEDIDLLNMGWPEFFSAVQADRHHGLERRIKVLDAAQALFGKYGSLASMSLTDRQGIGGIVESEDMPWGWFGSMRGAGVFKNLINENPGDLSEALNEIPLHGAVRHHDYEAFVAAYKGAFPVKNSKPHRHGLGTATRLLAMKRPDYFVCLDRANKMGISAGFGITVSNHDYEAYWESIIERICEAKWWNSRRPNVPQERKVWDGRAAFLDALYYEPVERTGD
jgi:HKD family nuclease